LAELVSQVHRLLKINLKKIQNSGQLMRLSDPFCIIIIIIIIIRYRDFLIFKMAVVRRVNF